MGDRKCLEKGAGQAGGEVTDAVGAVRSVESVHWSASEVGRIGKDGLGDAIQLGSGWDGEERQAPAAAPRRLRGRAAGPARSKYPSRLRGERGAAAARVLPGAVGRTGCRAAVYPARLDALEQKEGLFPVAARAKRLQGAIDALDNAVCALHRRLR